MQRWIWLVTVIIFNTNLALAQVVNVKWTNPEGQLDYLVESVWKNLDRWIKPCLIESGRCGLSSSEFQVLEKTFALYAQEKSKTTVEVMPSRFAQGYFDQHGGSARVAITGYKPFEPIYFNQDAMIDRNKGTIMSRSQIISFLVHELAHHTGIGDTEERMLDKIGNAVAQNFAKNSATIDLASQDMPLVGGYLHNIADFETLKRLPQKSQRIAQIGMHFGMAVWDYGPSLESFATSQFKECTKSNMQALHASNLRWFKLPNSMIPGTKLSFMADVRFLCGSSVHSAKEFRGYFTAFSILKRHNSKLVLEWESQGAGLANNQVFDGKVAATHVEVKMNTNVISGGGTWSGKAIITLSQDIAIKRCVNGLGADHFMKYITGVMVPYAMRGGCVLRKLAPAKYEISFKQDFLPTTKSGIYYLSEMNLVPEDTKIPRFSVLPAIRQSVTIRNTRDSVPELMQVRLYDKNTQDVTDQGLTLAPGDAFSIVMWVKNYSKIENLQLDTLFMDARGSAQRGYALLKNGAEVDKSIGFRENAQNGMMAIAVTYQPKNLNGFVSLTAKNLELFDANFNTIVVPLGNKFTMKVAR